MNKRYTPAASRVRVSVDICRRAVGGPSCMTYADTAADTAGLRKLFFKLRYAPLGLDNVNVTAMPAES